MYLSQILLNPFSRRVQGRHRTAYQTHRSILRAFPEPLPIDERVLFRREDVQDPPTLRLLVQSQLSPDWQRFISDHGRDLLQEPQVKRYEPVLQEGQTLVFRLVANPTIKRDGRRLGLLNETDQIAWLQRKGAAGGFDINVDSLRLTNEGFLRDASTGGQALSLLLVRFDGMLVVRDSRLFQQSLINGIGPGKGLGCGLLTVAIAS